MNPKFARLVLLHHPSLSGNSEHIGFGGDNISCADRCQPSVRLRDQRFGVCFLFLAPQPASVAFMNTKDSGETSPEDTFDLPRLLLLAEA